MDKKIEELAAALTSAEQTAKEILADTSHGKSPHAGPLRSRVLAALESLQAHKVWAAANPPAKEKLPQKSA